MSAKAMLIIMGAAALCLPAYTLVRLHRGQRNGWRRFSFISILLGITVLLLSLADLLDCIINGALSDIFDTTSAAMEAQLWFTIVGGILNVTVIVKGTEQ